MSDPVANRGLRTYEALLARISVLEQALAEREGRIAALEAWVNLQHDESHEEIPANDCDVCRILTAHGVPHGG